MTSGATYDILNLANSIPKTRRTVKIAADADELDCHFPTSIRTNTHIEPGQTLTIRKHMDALALLLAARPASQWAGWVVYLLEVLEGRKEIDEGDFVGLLADLQDNIEVRLSTGRWANGEVRRGNHHRSV